MREMHVELLSAWLKMSSSIRNDRVVTGMSYHEMHVCNLIVNAEEKDVEPLTATELCSRTGLLKSQMNKVLTGLEQKGILTRSQSTRDRRQMHLSITPKGKQIYSQEHQRILNFVDGLIRKIGQEDAKESIRLINIITDCITEILEDSKEVDI